MGLLKGEEIVHKKIRMPGHIPKAVKILEKIASFDQDVLEFIDLTENDLEAKKSFFPLIRRCENMEVKLNALEKFADEFNIPIDNFKNYTEFKNALYQDQQKRQIKDNTYFDYVESEIIEENKTILDLYESYNKIKENLMIELQRKITLEKYFSLTAATIIDQNNLSKSSARKKSSNRNNMIINNEENFDDFINNLNQSGMSNASVDSIIRENQYMPITGLCYAHDELRMKRMIFRVSHDKALCTFFDAEFPEEFKPKEEMKIFVMFCPKIDYLISKILKVCDIYNCPRFDIPDNYVGHVTEILPSISEKILEHKNYLFEAKKTLKSHLEDYILIKKKLQLYKIYFRKEKLIFLNISKCHCGDNFIDGEVWVLKKNFEKLQKKLNTEEDEESSVTFIDVKDYGMDRPTYIDVNDFTYPFQEIVNQYGIPNYHEINPGFFTIVTFPFLFGIMFGDMGHGLILFAISLYLFYLANKGRRRNNFIIDNDQMPENYMEQNILDSKEDSMLKSLVQFRYFFLICSIFAIFCGLIYNEFFSIPLDFFGTCYNNVKDGKLILDKEVINENKVKKCVYPIGLDPSWIGKQNELAYTNSLKMKLSIIVGVIHMLLGIGIKGVNLMNAKKFNAFIFEFIPQFFFMFILFGYLIYMIFYKWGTDYDGHTDKAPSILTIMINMAVKFGSVQGNPLFDSLFGLSQETINILIISICLIFIPIMLFVKPIYSYLKKKQTQGIKLRNDEDINLIENENKKDDNLDLGADNINKKNDNINNNLIIDDLEDEINNINNGDNKDNDNKSGEYSLSLSQESILRPDEHYSNLYFIQKMKYKEEAREKYKFVEIFIGQLIEVIEYVLGTVSNTASYLRLWALSLAHTALSHVFIEKTFIDYIQKDEVNFFSSIINVFIYFFVFLGATVFILIFMDAMECILHTLRLHWVEFQNKFYKGNGYLFNAFSFKNIFYNNANIKQ
jgi:V-type H+-transporting ATPase subunit a